MKQHVVVPVALPSRPMSGRCKTCGIVITERNGNNLRELAPMRGDNGGPMHARKPCARVIDGAFLCAYNAGKRSVALARAGSYGRYRLQTERKPMQYDFYDDRGQYERVDLDTEEDAVEQVGWDAMSRRSTIKVYEADPAISRDEALVAIAQWVGDSHILTSRRPFPKAGGDGKLT